MDTEDILNDLNDLSGSESEHSVEAQGDIETELTLTKHSVLLQSKEFIDHMNLINDLIDRKIGTGALKSHENQDMQIRKSNEFAAEIDRQINGLWRFVKSIYGRKFPELDSIISHPALYCKAVQQIETCPHGTKLQELKFTYLSSHQSISLRIALSSLHDRLPDAQRKQVIEVTTIAMLLHEHHNVLMMYLESCMQIVAPNLCQLVGSLVASKLISAAGGIGQLALMPACNIQVMGGHRAAQVGLSMLQRNHTGIFGQIDIVKDAPKRYQMQLVRMLATNTAKCARLDYVGTNKTAGLKIRQQMYQRFEAIQEGGGLLREDMPLPIPGEQPKKKRGGKRFRKTKQLYEMSDLRKNQNRMKFGEAEEEIQDGVGLGMIKSGMGKLKVAIKKCKLNVSKGMSQRMNKKTGLQSSLNLATSTGIELINPLLNQQQQQSGKETYFSKTMGFKTVLNNKFGIN